LIKIYARLQFGAPASGQPARGAAEYARPRLEKAVSLDQPAN
jgi:hypothetical protein